jgi:hypothetical protein
MGYFHALYWITLSWFGFCTKALRGFIFGCVVWVVDGGFMLWLGRSGVDRVMCGWVCGVVISRCLAFFGGLCAGARGEGW